MAVSDSDSSDRVAAVTRPVPIEERLRREEERLRALQEIAEALRSTLNLKDLLRLILAKITSLMEADRATLYLLDETQNELWSELVQGDEVLEIRLPIGEGIAGAVAKTGRSVVLRDAYRDARFHNDIDLKTGYRTRSMLCVPMRDNQGKIIGVIQVLNKLRGYFSPEDEHFLTTLATHAAISIEISRLYLSVLDKNMALSEAKRSLEEKVRELDLLYEVEQKMGTATDLGELLSVVVARSAEAIGAEAVGLVLPEEDGALVFSATFGAPALHGLRLPRGAGLIGRAVALGESHASADLIRDPRHERRISGALGFLPRASLIVPLKGERVVGALQLFRRQELPFDDGDQKLAALLAGRAAQAILTQRAREERANASRLESIGRMLSGIVHDFKTPMAIVSGYAELAAAEDDPTLRHEHTQALLRQLSNINGMVREILAFAKGDRQLLLRRVLLNNFGADIEKMLRTMTAGTLIELDVRIEYKDAARLDEIKITRVISNLARNALQAMPGGGRLGFHIVRNGDELVLMLSDTGGGIPREVEGRIFDSFVTHGKRDGTGLGLSIVKKLVEDHGGRISYSSQPGRGTTFLIMLPLDGPPAEESVS